MIEYALIKEDVDAVLELLANESLPTPQPSGAASGTAASVQTPPTTSAADEQAATPGDAAAATIGKANAELCTVLAKMEDDNRNQWNAAAVRLVRQYTRIIVNPETSALLAQEIQASTLGKASGDMTGLLIFHYDVKLFGEPITAPHVRIAPFQDKVYEKLVGAVLQARWQGAPEKTPCLNVGEVVLLLDGGRHGTPSVLHQLKA